MKNLRKGDKAVLTDQLLNILEARLVPRVRKGDEVTIHGRSTPSPWAGETEIGTVLRVHGDLADVRWDDGLVDVDVSMSDLDVQ
jgi:hypothetical protein